MYVMQEKDCRPYTTDARSVLVLNLVSIL